MTRNVNINQVSRVVGGAGFIASLLTGNVLTGAASYATMVAGELENEFQNEEEERARRPSKAESDYAVAAGEAELELDAWKAENW